MVVYVEYCLFCNECDENWFDNGRGCEKPMERRQLAADEDGWVSVGRGASLRDYCPDCSAKFGMARDREGRSSA